MYLASFQSYAVIGFNYKQAHFIGLVAITLPLVVCVLEVSIVSTHS